MIHGGSTERAPPLTFCGSWPAGALPPRRSPSHAAHPRCDACPRPRNGIDMVHLRLRERAAKQRRAHRVNEPCVIDHGRPPDYVKRCESNRAYSGPSRLAPARLAVPAIGALGLLFVPQVRRYGPAITSALEASCGVRPRRGDALAGYRPFESDCSGLQNQHQHVGRRARWTGFSITVSL